MKAYVITLMNLPESVRLAERCIDSAKKFNIDVEMFRATDRANAEEERLINNIPIGSITDEYADPAACLGCFMSMYRLWEKIASSRQSTIILEHDAVFTDALPDYISGDIVNLARPSYGDFNTKQNTGIYSLFSKSGGYFPGSHGYLLTPKGASKLILAAKQDGAYATDLFLCKQRFKDLKEIYPWIIEAHSEFSTIQNTAGVQAQHAFRKYTEQGLSYQTAQQIWSNG